MNALCAKFIYICIRFIIHEICFVLIICRILFSSFVSLFAEFDSVFLNSSLSSNLSLLVTEFVLLSLFNLADIFCGVSEFIHNS